MELVKITESNMDMLPEMIAEFRTVLRSYKGIAPDIDIDAGKEEAEEFLKKGNPMYYAEEDGNAIGYAVYRIENDVLWVEHLYVRAAYRRKGAASLLFDKAEEISASLGNDTVFNYIHPNNTGIIHFLESKGYTVLNLVEIRKPYKDEVTKTKIQVGDHSFDY